MQTPIYFHDISKKLNEIIAKNEYGLVFILTDCHTESYCLPKLTEVLKGNFETVISVIEAGEANKNLSSATDVWKQLAENRQSRKILMLNLGGGMVTDLGGFVAATFMRGIDFINLPTSLLAMVDASVGGKTAVNLGLTKNLVGAFSWPLMTLIDVNYLETLPKREFTAGLAEMLKHGLIQDRNHWNQLKEKENLSVENIGELIQQSIQIKLAVTAADPKEKGWRKILNFGHTVGHAIESVFMNEEQSLLHGEAIAAGMLVETILSQMKNGLKMQEVDEVFKVILQYFEPIVFEETTVLSLIDQMKFDKKNHLSQINFSLLKEIGQCEHDIFVDETDLLQSFQTYHQRLIE